MASIQVDTGGNGWLRRVPWRTVGLAVALVLVAGAAGVGLRLWQERGRATEPLAKLPKVVSDVQNLRLSGDAEAADKKISEALSDPSLDSKMRADLYIQQGHSLVEKTDYAGAIKAYLEAEKLNPTRSVAWLLGDMYRKVDDTKQAIVFYKKAIERIPANDPLADNDTEYLQLLVKDLEAEQAP